MGGMNPVADTEVASAYRTVGVVFAHAGMSNHRILNLVNWKILLQHFRPFPLRLVDIRFWVLFAVAR